LKIESAEADRLARELAEQTGESVEDAVLNALRRALLHEKLDRINRETRREPTRFPIDDPHMIDRVREIQERVARLPVLDDRSADELLGYDEWGLPH